MSIVTLDEALVQSRQAHGRDKRWLSQIAYTGVLQDPTAAASTYVSPTAFLSTTLLNHPRSTNMGFCPCAPYQQYNQDFTLNNGNASQHYYGDRRVGRRIHAKHLHLRGVITCRNQVSVYDNNLLAADAVVHMWTVKYPNGYDPSLTHLPFDPAGNYPIARWLQDDTGAISALASIENCFSADGVGWAYEVLDHRVFPVTNPSNYTENHVPAWVDPGYTYTVPSYTSGIAAHFIECPSETCTEHAQTITHSSYTVTVPARTIPAVSSRGATCHSSIIPFDVTIPLDFEVLFHLNPNVVSQTGITSFGHIMKNAVCVYIMVSRKNYFGYDDGQPITCTVSSLFVYED